MQPDRLLEELPIDRPSFRLLRSGRIGLIMAIAGSWKEMMMRRLPLVSMFALCAPLAGALHGQVARPEIVIADFEGQDYGGWKTTGEAFGPGPARGTLPGQMAVSGFLGHGLVNSFFRGDDATGTLTSSAFRIERAYLNFLIGGGGYPGETCINLLVDGKVVRTATGPNDEPGGSERLRWHTWDVRELAGKLAVIEIVDAGREDGDTSTSIRSSRATSHDRPPPRTGRSRSSIATSISRSGPVRRSGG